MPGFECNIDPSNDADGFIVARFLHDNCFFNSYQIGMPQVGRRCVMES